MTDKQTCPRRRETGPWPVPPYDSTRDTWHRSWAETREAADAIAVEALSRGTSSMGDPLWRWTLPIPRVCSFCGGIHPDDAIRLVEEGWTVEPTDKRYKRYLHPPVSTAQGLSLVPCDDPVPPVKLYTQHFSVRQAKEFNRALQGGTDQ